MAVLHITYKRPETSKAEFEGFYKAINSYRYIRLSESNWAVYTDEAPTAVWQKVMRYTDPDEYLVMLPLEAPSWSSQDAKALQWILSRP